MLSPHELLQVALNIETEGKDFYEYLAANVDSETARATFRYLMVQEEEHVVIFRKLLREFEEESLGLVNWEDASPYLRDFSQGKVFPPARELIKRFENASSEQVVDYAISREEETVVFYENLLEFTSPGATSQPIVKIIEEEKSHIKLLKELK